jgi:hypothetical protein
MLARLIFLGPNNNGRSSSPLPGYHPQLRIDEVQTSCAIYPVDLSVQIFEFDRDYDVTLHLLFTEYAGRLHPGDRLEFFEGFRKVAFGTLLSIAIDA